MVRKRALVLAAVLTMPLAVAAAPPASACGHRAFFVSEQYSADEPGSVTVAIRRDANACGGPSSVDYMTVDDSAKAGTDYTATSGTVTFNNPESSDAQRTFTVPILDDGDAEGAETFRVVLKDNVAQRGVISNLGGPATITIAANDQPAAPEPTPTTAPPATTTTVAAAPTTAPPPPTTAPPRTTVPPVATTSTTSTTTVLDATPLEAVDETTTTVTPDTKESASDAKSSDGDGGSGAAPLLALLALLLVAASGVGFWLWKRGASSPGAAP